MPNDEYNFELDFELRRLLGEDVPKPVKYENNEISSSLIGQIQHKIELQRIKINTVMHGLKQINTELDKAYKELEEVKNGRVIW